MLRTNKVKAKIQAGEKAYGCLLGFPSPTIVELLGYAGFDYVMVDAEHGPFTPQSAEDMFRVADSVGLTPLVRVPDNQPSTILRYLDRGAAGVQVPHVNTRAEAQAVVEAVKFYPLGKRGLGSVRAGSYDAAMSRSEYVERSNRETMIIVQLEQAEALANLEEILQVDHIDVFTFGGYDLSQSMGVPGQPNHPRVQEAIQQASAKIRAAGRVVGRDVMVSGGAYNFFLAGATEFLQQARQG